MLECVLKSQTLLLVELSDHSASPCFQKKEMKFLISIHCSAIKNCSLRRVYL
ncbi:hypothetical protein GBAR_LOCUS21581 [Geodia barretti]|uniref:Uncharacterized protein n=1 Tax=Geodia barretti TaxID=519541 RepID=A0AA35X5B8_GEOBA|nr:hypothetical protein GBAR_LOCUS21581 [Geodia barretti]